MLGDNIYEGPATRDDYRRKFEEPYRRLLDEGVKFYAVARQPRRSARGRLPALQHGR